MKQIKIYVLCVLAFLNIAHATDIDWRVKTVQTIKLIYDNIKTHHPGMLDKKNPNFLNDLNNDYDNAVNQAQSAQNSNDLITIAEQFAHNDFRRTMWQRPGMPLGRNNPSAGETTTKAKIEIHANRIEAYFPTFGFKTDDDAQPMREEIASLKKLAREQKFDTLIINLKGNHAIGSSRWGNEIFKAVWGERFYEILMSQHQNKVYYRVTPENNANMKVILKRAIPEEYKKRFVDIEQKMEQALHSGATTELLAYQEEINAINEVLPPLKFSIQIHTDGQISRAARPFLGMALKASAKLCGASIPMCSAYSEVRDIEIFEGHKLWLPIAACYEDNCSFEPTSL